jgi:hypothetical protein
MTVNLSDLLQFHQVLTLIREVMKKINRTLWAHMMPVLLLATSACKMHPHGDPPVQVKKVTGTHPISGKVKGKATAPDFDTGTPKIKDRTFLPVLADFRSKTGSFSAVLVCFRRKTACLLQAHQRQYYRCKVYGIVYQRDKGERCGTYRRQRVL